MGEGGPKQLSAGPKNLQKKSKQSLDFFTRLPGRCDRENKRQECNLERMGHNAPTGADEKRRQRGRPSQRQFWGRGCPSTGAGRGAPANRGQRGKGGMGPGGVEADPLGLGGTRWFSSWNFHCNGAGKVLWKETGRSGNFGFRGVFQYTFQKTHRFSENPGCWRSEL